MMPFQILGMWLRCLLTPILLSSGITLLLLWYNQRETVVWEPRPAAAAAADPAPDEGPPRPADDVRLEPRVERWSFGWNWPTAFLLIGCALVLWSIGGGWSYPRLFRRTEKHGPKSERTGEVLEILRPDGTLLRVEAYGPPDGMPLVLTHGWSLDSGAWYYAKHELAQRHRVLVWDLPGLGHSRAPASQDYSLEKLAGDLDAVIDSAGFRPAVLVGHSIGGMIILTYCRLFPQKVGQRVRGIVLAQTTYTNPVKTCSMPTLMQALQKPLLEPLCRLMIWLSPVVRVLNWLSYLNGSAHRSTERSSFSGRETRKQLEFLTRLYVPASPAVVARGFLGMFRYDVTDVLGKIEVPTLVVSGDRDSTCKPEAGSFIADNIPRARLETLSSSRHCGLFEHHSRFHALVDEFVATLETVAPDKASSATELGAQA